MTSRKLHPVGPGIAGHLLHFTGCASRRHQTAGLSSARGSVVELSELMRGAQEAMDRGEYQVATRACTHALEAYPSCITAHRVIGEAHLERGQADLATQHFDRTLEIDPLNVIARLGLGVASEERQDPSTAYMHYLNAWETNPP